MPRRYTLDQKPLGRGGQAEVFRAHDLENPGSPIAYKRFMPGLFSKERFYREIRIQKELASEHVMPILDVGPDNAWYVMPLASRTFAALKSAPDQAIASALLQAVMGLAVAHSRGIVHRDFKPDNILLISEGRERWVLADFGLTRRELDEISTRLTATDQFVGTLLFAAPETWEGAHETREPADIYSVGRVAAWATSEKRLAPLRPATTDRSLWMELVEATTAEDPSGRPEISSVIRMLTDIRRKAELSQDLDESFIGVRCYRCKQAFSEDRSNCPHCGYMQIDY